MDLLDISHHVKHHTFYVSSCESGSDSNSNFLSKHSSISSFESININLSKSSSTIPSNIFLNILKRLHCLMIHRKKNNQYRSLSTSWHYFIKTKHQHTSLTNIKPSFIKFYKSSSSPQLSIKRISNTKYHRSCQQLYHNRMFNKNNFQIRQSFKQNFTHSDKTVSEDNNTNTLNSVDLTRTSQLLPTICTAKVSSLDASNNCK